VGKRGPDACGAVVRFLEHATAGNWFELPFIRMLPPPEREEAGAYLGGLIEHARQRKAVPAVPDPATHDKDVPGAPTDRAR